MTKKPDYQSHEEFINRSRKLTEIRELGIDPYPHVFTPTTSIKQILDYYGTAELPGSDAALAGETDSAAVAGRLILFRPMGKNCFAQIQSEGDALQIMFNRDASVVEGVTATLAEGETSWKAFEKKLDLGDIIGVEGHLFRTGKGELTLFVKRVTLLCKTLLPLAEKHAGLSDKETRYRKRWLDLISTPECHQLFVTRSRIIKMLRDFMHERDFMEVETPVLQSVYGGAEARPFETNLHALDQDMFMRISLEIPLKKLIVGGMPRVFEIGRVFRNEGIDRTHNPEFTMMEAYAAYWDYEDMMVLVETLFETLAMQLYGTSKVAARDPHTDEEISLDLKAPWKRMTMNEAIKTFGGHDVEKLSDAEMLSLLKESGEFPPEKLKNLTRGLLIARLFELVAEPKLIQPHHIIDHPIETTPLCKLHREPKKRQEGVVERFESFVLCKEICNAYTELNDPVFQRELLEQQAEKREKGDKEASPLDEEFIEAICQGMPPTAGVGIGIDRMAMILTNTHSIRDILLFPWMKPT